MVKFPNDGTWLEVVAYWRNLLDNLQQFVEAEQDAPRLRPWDKDPNYIWNPPRKDRDGRGDSVPENGRLG